jgi:N-acetylneuraminic acid mutarotase
MRTPRNRHAAAVLDGRVYVAGGRAPDERGRVADTASVEVYDPASGAWTAAAPMPTARHGLVLLALEGRLYAIGGYAGGMTGAVEVYDPATRAWRALPALPTPRGFFGAMAHGGRIHVFGGRLWDAPTEIYDPAAGRWTAGSPIPADRNRFGLAVVEGRAYLVAGEDRDGTAPADAAVLVYDGTAWTAPGD